MQVIADGTPPDGLGTETAPYLIESLDNLLWLSTTDSVWCIGNYFEQTQDIDASSTQDWNNGAGFIPIGTDYYHPFQGDYNGDSYFINNLYINRPNSNYIGLFGHTMYAKIENLSLINVNITGDERVGAMVGRNYGTSIINCHTSGSVNGINRIGGLVGATYAASYISGCNSSCNVEGVDYIGGLAGYHREDSHIWESYATGEISGYYRIGGLVGYNYKDSQIHLCYSSGNVEGTENVGGLVGYNEYDSEVKKSYATGNVTGSDHYIGGLIGRNYDSTISECFAMGTVVGIGYIGGLIGRNYTSEISNCYALGDVSGNGIAGGLIGSNTSYALISNCYTCGSVSVANDSGGMLGSNSWSSIENSIWNIETTGQAHAIGSVFYSTENNLLGKTTAEMQEMSTYTDIGWDFSGENINGTLDIWTINSSINNGFPYLFCIELPGEGGESEILNTRIIFDLKASPNPFNPRTTISFDLIQDTSYLKISIYNIRGQKVWQRSIVSAVSGRHSYIWRGNNSKGQPVASGIYFYRISVPTDCRSGKVVLLK